MKKLLFNIKSAILTVIVFTGVISFNNCAKKNWELSVSNQENKGDKVIVVRASLQDVDAVEHFNPSLLSDQNSFPSTIRIDLQTGKGFGVTYQLDGSKKLDSQPSLCLPADILKELQTLIHDSKICEIQPAPRDPSDPPMMCAQMMKVPYATLLSQKQEIPLGGGNNSCDFGPDLCDSQSSQKLKELVLDVINRHQELICL